jgi:hypothetical protein
MQLFVPFISYSAWGATVPLCTAQWVTVLLLVHYINITGKTAFFFLLTFLIYGFNQNKRVTMHAEILHSLVEICTAHVCTCTNIRWSGKRLMSESLKQIFITFLVKNKYIQPMHDMIIFSRERRWLLYVIFKYKHKIIIWLLWFMEIFPSIFLRF